MTSILRRDFIQEFQGRPLSVSALSGQPGLRPLQAAITAADKDHNGKIDSPAELAAVFDAIDQQSGTKNRTQLTLDSAGAPTAAGLALVGLRAVAAQTAAATSPYRDIALARVFPAAPSAPLDIGARGAQVSALQYALGRAGLLSGRVDASFGPATQRAVRAFQHSAGLPETGAADAATLAALDAAVATLDPRVAAERASSVWSVLDDFSRLSPLPIQNPAAPHTWNDADVQTAYRQFVQEYWPVMRDNRMEMDCKTVSYLLMTQFRKMYQQQTAHALPLPASADGARAIPPPQWTVFTRANPGTLFQRTDAVTQLRPGYDAVTRVETLDPTQSMLYGVNLRDQGVTADSVARTSHVISAPTQNVNHGDQRVPEIDIQALQPGDMIFLNHNEIPKNPPPGFVDHSWDHCVTVVGVERNAEGRVTRLVLAVGSFDDIKDADSTTSPRGLFEINHYMEELTIDFDAQGHVAGSQTTWSSEPSWLVTPRYMPSNTIMDMHPGGAIFAGRWGSRR